MSLRTVLGGVGAAVGFYLGGPGGARWGYMIGSTVGAIVDPGTIKGPSIGEIANQTAQEGGPRPIAIGISVPIPGNVIAQGPARVVKKKKGGKGGPKVQTETVYRTYAIGVIEGPISAFRRIWRNNVLVYDSTGTSALTDDDNTAFLEQARLFLGDWDQLPSPDLEAIFGAGTTPAHRGTAYMVMVDEDLTSLSGAIPQWVFQVANGATEPQLRTDALYPWVESATDPRNADNTHEYRYYLAYGAAYPGHFEAVGPGAWRTTLAAAVADGNAITYPGPRYINQLGWTRTIEPDDTTSGNANRYMSRVFDLDPGEHELLRFTYNFYAPTYYNGPAGFGLNSYLVCSNMPNFVPPIVVPDGIRYWWSGLVAYGDQGGGPNYSGTFTLTATGSAHNAAEIGINNCANYSGLPQVYGSPDCQIEFRRVPGKPPGEWEAVAGSYKVLAAYSAGNVTLPQNHNEVLQYPLGPCLEVGDARDTSAFWTAAYNAAVLAGTMPAGKVYPTHYPVAKATAWFGNLVSVDGQIPVSSLVEQICNRAGLPSELLDLTGLEGLSTYGITITNQYAAAEAIRSIGQMKFFDTVSRDAVVAFLPRGSDHVADIVEDDMVDMGGDVLSDERDDSISVPRVVNMNYYDIAGGLVTDKQTSERAGDRRSVGEASLQSPVLMSADECAKAVVVNHKVLAENSRGTIKFALSDRFIGLVPGDAIIVQIGEANRRLRIENATTLDGYQSYELAFDRQSAYTSNVEGIPAAPQTAPPTSIVGATLIVPLDIPLLKDADDNLGLAYYVAVAGVSPAWSGALIELSRDGGANYTDSEEATAQSVIGELHTEMGDHPAEFPDTHNIVQIHLETLDAELEATDLAGMLNRVNLAAIGTPELGFELVNFANVEQSTSEIWTIGYFLRGRRGTEPRAHAAGEQFVLLERAQLGLIPADLSDLGRTLTFRATSFGAPADTGTVVDMPFAGMTQRERQPGYLTAHRAADDLLISWQGVGRLGGGASAVQGARFSGYRVRIEDGVHDAIVVDTSDQATTQDITDVLDPYKVSVTQVNELTGEGPAAFWPEQEAIPALSTEYLWALGQTHPFEIGGTWVNRIYFLDAPTPFYMDVRFIRTAGLDYSLHMFPLDATSVADRLNAYALADQVWGLVRDPDDPDIIYWSDGLIATRAKVLNYSGSPILAQQSYGLADMIISDAELFVAHLVDPSTNYIDVLDRTTLNQTRQLALGSKLPFRFIHGTDASAVNALWICDSINGTHQGQLHRIDRDTGVVDKTIEVRRFPMGGLIRGGFIYVYCKNSDVGHAAPAGFGVFKYQISDGAEVGYWINAEDLEQYIGQESNAVVVRDPYLAVAWGAGHKVFDTSAEAYIAAP